jgi:hypothetical protein
MKEIGSGASLRQKREELLGDSSLISTTVSCGST